jgi:catalase
MRADGNGGSSPNYWPNSFDDVVIDPSYKEPAFSMESTLTNWYDRNTLGEDDHYTQPGNLFRHLMTDADRQHLIHNIVISMQGIASPKRDEIVARQLCHFCRADIQLGLGVAAGLRIDIASLLPTAGVGE